MGDGKGWEMGKNRRWERMGDGEEPDLSVSSVTLTVSTARLVATEAEVAKQLCCRTEIS